MTYEEDLAEITEKDVEEYVRRNPWMTAHTKGILRAMLKRENDWCMREAVREDNHNTRY